MKTTLCTWEDEICNRHVQFSVDFVIDRGAVTVKNVTPRKISFVCPHSNTVQGTLGVHTDAGRHLLVDQFRNSDAWAKLATTIANPNGDSVIPQMSIRMEVAGVE
ncbi:MAG: hypothetical protein ACR2NP_18890 [Pirellulaceae bacterium]